MALSGVRAVALDLDGTLLDTAGDVSAAANAMLTGLDLPSLPPDRVRSFIGLGVGNLIRRTLSVSLGAAGAESVFKRAESLFVASYEEHLSDTTAPFDGITESLEALCDAGFPLACITNKPERFTRPLLERMGLASFFRLVVAGDTLPRRKPDPLPLLHTAQAFAMTPTELLMVGDSAHDAQAARAAGCPVLLVPYGYRDAGVSVESIDSDGVLPSLTMLLPRLRGGR